MAGGATRAGRAAERRRGRSRGALDGGSREVSVARSIRAEKPSFEDLIVSMIDDRPQQLRTNSHRSPIRGT